MVRQRFIATAIIFSALFCACITPKGDEVSMPPWAEKGPKASDYREAYPAAARHRQVIGLVHLACSVRTDRRLDCAVENENPPGMGFGEAALLV